MVECVPRNAEREKYVNRQENWRGNRLSQKDLAECWDPDKGSELHRIGQQLWSLVQKNVLEFGIETRKVHTIGKDELEFCGFVTGKRNLVLVVKLELIRQRKGVITLIPQASERTENMGDVGLFEDLSLDHLPEWTNLLELLAAIEEQLGRQVRQQIEDTLDRDPNEVINVRELLADIQNELGGSYFDSLLQDEDGESGLTTQ